MTLTDAHAAMASLRSELAASTWSPSAAEYDAAQETVLQSGASGVTLAEAITSGIRGAGTEGATEIAVADGGSRLTRLMKQCADLLSDPGFAATPDAGHLDRELRRLLNEVADRRPRSPVLERLRRRRSQEEPTG
ncbi:hypothetical protein ACFT4A_30395 [Streptomyces sp. NPDC057099]|uniref:hypothetical protein n=1 Tax=Streptomyces sp. NPDC057099 TaxID=3346019 RepID=UPI00363B2F06